MFKYEEPEMEIILLGAQNILTVSNAGNITDSDEGETPFVPPTGTPKF